MAGFDHQVYVVSTRLAEKILDLQRTCVKLERVCPTHNRELGVRWCTRCRISAYRYQALRWPISKLIVKFPRPLECYQSTEIGPGRDGLVHEDLYGCFMLIDVTQRLKELSDIGPALEVARHPGLSRPSAVFNPHHGCELLCRRYKLRKAATNCHGGASLSIEIALGG